MRKHHHHHHHHHYHGGRRPKDSYAYHAGDPGPGPNHFKLRRSVRDRQFAGICGGLAEYYGWNVSWLRIGWVLATVFMFPVPLFFYIAAAIFIKPEESSAMRSYENAEDEKFWRTFSTRPSMTFSELKHRFRALDARISDMEILVTSNEYGLRKAFSDLEKDR